MSHKQIPRQQPLRTPPQGCSRRLDSEALFGGSREVTIEHKGQVYRLRITRYDRLILTK